MRTAIARLLAVHTEERGYRIGAAGEEAVARHLRKLDARWHVVHSVPVGRRGADIDHVVIGPTGVFTLNTKHHPGGRVGVRRETVTVNGRRTDYLGKARFEAARASRLLAAACGCPVPVRPVLVVLAARLDVRRPPADVAVVEAKTLVRWLGRQPAALAPEEVARIFGAARRDTTWRMPPG